MVRTYFGNGAGGEVLGSYDLSRRRFQCSRLITVYADDGYRRSNQKNSDNFSHAVRLNGIVMSTQIIHRNLRLDNNVTEATFILSDGFQLSSQT